MATDTENIEAAGDLIIPNRRSLTKAAAVMPSEAFGEIGTTGLRQYGGFVIEEWLGQLAGRRAAWVWREMLDNDPTVGAIMFAIRWLARGVEWRVAEGSQPEAAELVETCMDDMSHSWGDFISEALSMLPYGWAFHESVYKRRQGPQQPRIATTLEPMNEDGTQENDSNLASSKYKDGRIGWRKLPIRAQETLLNWDFDGYSGLQAMHQIDWHGGDHHIPIEKAVLFRTQTTRENPEGRSMLRNAYTSYFALKTIKQIEAIGIERDLAGIPVATAPESVDIFSPGKAALYSKVRAMVTGVRRDEYEGIILPAGWQFELLSSAGGQRIDTDQIVRRYRQDIATSMLADFVLIGQDAVGSFAMVDVKSDLFGVAIDGILDLLCEVMNKYAIPRLLALNGMDVSDPPQIEHGSAGRIDLEKVGNFLFQLAGAGAPVPWNLQLLKSLFLEAGLPANFEEATEEEIPEAAKPQSEIDAEQQQLEAVGPAKLQPGNEEPFSREAHMGKAPPPQPAEPLSKADAQTGAMVALYPHPDVAHAIAQDGGEDERDLHLTLAYLGQAHELGNPDALRHAVIRWAANTPPLTGVLSGVGRFTQGPKPVTYASADLPDLPEHRQRLIGHLEAADSPASTDHGFTPHITLAYGRNNVTPTVHAHALRFDRASLVIAGQREDFDLTGKPRPTVVSKADRKRVRGGTAIDVSSRLRQRHAVLSAQLEQEINSALGQLGEQAATAYATIAHKASAGMLHRLVARVLRALNLGAWVEQHLKPILANHAGRVTADTQRTIQAEIHLEAKVADADAQRIIDCAGQGLGMRDIEPQIRQSIMDAIRKGLEAGENPVKTAARIRADVPAGRFVNAGARYRSRLIARDQTAKMQRKAAVAAYQSNPRITGVRLRDGIFGPPRSDAECIARDGDLVPIDEADSVHSEHPQCTLSLDPVVSGTLPEPAAAPELVLA